MSSSPRTVRKPRPLSGTAAKRDFWVRFWGVRGSIPAPGSSTARYGGNTACLEVRCGDELLVFDLGSGARALGASLKMPVQATLFLTHYHYDHLQGLPFFEPLFDSRNRFVLHGPSRNSQTIEQILFAQLQPPYFPVTPEVFRARVEYQPFEAGQQHAIGEARVSAVELNHPGGCLGYRVDYRGRSLVYATDVEHGSNLDARFADFARGTDLLIYDAMYTADEYFGRAGAPKAGWGHSTWQGAVEAATHSGAKRLALFHHEPGRDDATVERLLKEARAKRADAFAARESARVFV